MRVVHTLEPIYDKASKILILGTMPSVKSREQAFYYAHPQNRFWKIMAQLFECSLETKEEKTAFCHQHHIALYDVLESCDIQGSSDSSIKNAKPNDLYEILQNSQIEMIFTTEKKAYSLYQKYQEKQTGIEAICLASPSPANASKKLEDLIEDYQVILKYTA